MVHHLPALCPSARLPGRRCPTHTHLRATCGGPSSQRSLPDQTDTPAALQVRRAVDNRDKQRNWDWTVYSVVHSGARGKPSGSPSSSDTGHEEMRWMDMYHLLYTRAQARYAHTRMHTLAHNVTALFARVFWYALQYRLLLSCVRPEMRNSTPGPVLHPESPLKTFVHASHGSQREQHILPKTALGRPG